jgi:hypothetical protein
MRNYQKQHILNFGYNYLRRCVFKGVSSLYGIEWHQLQIEIQYGGYSNETVLGILLGKGVELIRSPHRHWSRHATDTSATAMSLLHKNSLSAVGSTALLGPWYLYLTSTVLQYLTGPLHHHPATARLHSSTGKVLHVSCTLHHMTSHVWTPSKRHIRDGCSGSNRKLGSSFRGNPLLGVSVGCLPHCTWEPFPMALHLHLQLPHVELRWGYSWI